MIDTTRLKQLLADRNPARKVAARINPPARVEDVHRWHDQTFALIRDVLDQSGVSYTVPAVKISLRGDMPGLACGQEVSIQAPDGRQLVIASVGPRLIHVEALPMIRIVIDEAGDPVLVDERASNGMRAEQLTSASFVAFLERWAANEL